MNALYDSRSNPRWAETFAPIIKGVVEDAAGHWVTETGVEVGTAFNVHNLQTQDWFNTAALQFATPISQTSKDEIAGLLQQGEAEGWTISTMQVAMTDLFNQWIHGNTDAAGFAGQRLPPYRTEMIARTVSMQAYNAGSTALYEDSGVEEQEWVATNDDRTRETHAAANGQVVRVGEPFDVGGSQMLYPGDDSLGADVAEIVNCRCTTVPIIPEGGLVNSGGAGDEGIDFSDFGTGSLVEVLPPADWTSVDHARAWMADKYPDMVFQWNDKASIEGTQKVLAQFDTLAQKYPEVAKRMGGLYTAEFGDPTLPPNIAALGDNVAAYASKADGSIHYFTDYLTNIEQQKPGYGKWLVQDTTNVEGTMTHEFGHQVKFWLEEQHGQAFSENVRLSGYGLVDETTRMWVQQVMPSSSKSLSQYGLSNQDELFAEVFKARELVPASKWTKVTKQFDEFMTTVADTSQWIKDYEWLDKLPMDERQIVGGQLYLEGQAMGLFKL